MLILSTILLSRNPPNFRDFPVHDCCLYVWLYTSTTSKSHKIVSHIKVLVVQSWRVSETGTASIKNTLIRKLWVSGPTGVSLLYFARQLLLFPEPCKASTVYKLISHVGVAIHVSHAKGTLYLWFV